jgi:hypothetical protein
VCFISFDRISISWVLVDLIEQIDDSIRAAVVQLAERPVESRQLSLRSKL